MLKEDNRKEYQRQAFKQHQIKRKSLQQVVRYEYFSDFDKVFHKIKNNVYNNEKEKHLDQQYLIDEVQNIRNYYRNDIIERNHHNNRNFSPKYNNPPLIEMNHKKQDRLVQTLAKYVKNKNDFLIKDIN